MNPDNNYFIGSLSLILVLNLRVNCLRIDKKEF